jgi:hypothetical protein
VRSKKAMPAKEETMEVLRMKEEKSIEKKMENPRLRFALESIVSMWRIKDKPTSTDCYESFKQISKRENVFCVTRRQFGNYLNILEEAGLIKTEMFSKGRQGVKRVITVPKIPREAPNGSDITSDLFWETVLSKETLKTQELASNLFDNFETQKTEPGAISMSINEASHDADFDLENIQHVLYSSARSTEFVKMLRPSDCVISTRPARWLIETKKWLVEHDVSAKNVYLRPKRYKPSKNDCIIFKAATIDEQEIGLYLDDKKEIANGIKHVLPNLVTCYLDVTPNTTQIVLRY